MTAVEHDDPFHIPAFLLLTQEQRRDSWRRYDAQRAAAKPAPTPASMANTAGPALTTAPSSGAEDTERTILDEADRRWRDWLPPHDGRERSRPRRSTFVRLVRREHRALAKAAAPTAKAAGLTKPATPRAASRAPSPATSSTDKHAAVLALLQQPGGASVAQLTAATGWKPHTLRARLSGMAKPVDEGGLGLTIQRTRAGDVTTYWSPTP